MKQPQTIYVRQDTPGLAPLVELLQAAIDDNADKLPDEYAVVFTQPTLTASGEIAFRSMMIPANLAQAISHILKFAQEVQP